jgi:putative oxidoreductase
MLVHGIARAYAGGVAPFGGFLNATGVPFGTAVAGAVTGFEIIGGASLLAGRYPAPIAAIWAFQLIAGIVMVHAREGWFVVGLGRNGMEYSVALIVCCAAVVFDSGRKK